MDLGKNADDGEETAGAAAFFTIAEEKIFAASSAEIGDKNIAGTKARSEKLRAIGFAKIEMHRLWRWLVAGGPHVQPLQRIWLIPRAGFVEVFRGIGELGRELRDQLGADFVAASADRRTNCGQQV